MKKVAKTINSMFVFVVMVTMIIPFVFINRDENAVTYRENRPLAHFPRIHAEEGFMGYNIDIGSEIEDYINDRIGFRDALIFFNAKIQYYVFGKMEDTDRYRLGPKGEFNIIEGNMVETYQHKNLFNVDELQELTNDFDHLGSYLSDRGMCFYFVECWDKESIYPEYFPNSVIQYGDTSRTEQFIDALETIDSVNVVSMKPEFMALKDQYELYSPYGNPVHWTPRGAYTGYTLIMDAINKDCDDEIYVLPEDAFDITMTEQGMVFYGGVTHSNVSEHFDIRHQYAEKMENPQEEYSEFKDVRSLWYKNTHVDNDKRVLIVGNSFIYNYIIDYFAESFSETLFIYSFDEQFDGLVESYAPDIVIYEVAERYTNYSNIMDTIKKLGKTD